jgi:hypothetical protein
MKRWLVAMFAVAGAGLGCTSHSGTPIPADVVLEALGRGGGGWTVAMASPARQPVVPGDGGGGYDFPCEPGTGVWCPE